MGVRCCPSGQAFTPGVGCAPSSCQDACPMEVKLNMTGTSAMNRVCAGFCILFTCDFVGFSDDTKEHVAYGKYS